MAKTTQERIEALQHEIQQKQNQEKQLKQKFRVEQRKARNHRLCKRHGFLEKVLPETIDLTEEQFEKFAKQHIANDHGRRMLAKLTAPNSTDKAPAKPATSQQAAPALSGGDGGERKEG